MKIIKLSSIQIRNSASVAWMSIGTAGLLSTVCAYSSTIPAGDASYQWLWCGWASVGFALCVWFSVLLSAEGVRCFPRSVAWGLILMGAVEAVWGMRQIYGFASSNHSLYAVTGSFYNPGPYSGYLALVFPVCLYEWLRLGAVKQRSRMEHAGYYFSSGVLFLLLCVLPAGMSRSAWLAAGLSGLLVGGMHCSWGARLKQGWQEHRARVVLAGIVCTAVLLAGSVGVYYMKEDSAKGRLFMWKISTLAVAQRPLLGHGMGHFVAAYGQAQETYFTKGDYAEDEERVAGSPEYAFNEYLRIAVEGGIPLLLLILAAVGYCLYRGMKRRRIGICGGLVALLVFSFSSYPMTYPCFLVAFLLLLSACLSGRSRRWMLVLGTVVGVAGVYLVRHNTYDACREWSQCRMLYGVGAYGSAKEGYEELYPLLKGRPRFLFEYGCCLHKLEEYKASNRVLQEAELHCCDPMVLNVMGKNCQALGEYEKAEACFLRSTHRLPGRIYPYYLLTQLYAEPAYRHPEKLKRAAEVVLTKEPKVQSTAVREMREEVKKKILNEALENENEK